MDEQTRPRTTALVIGPGYFRTLVGDVVSGRDFNAADDPSGIRVAIVNRKFASLHWPRGNPLGKRVRLVSGQTPDAWRTIVGVAPNIAQNSAVRRDEEPVVYTPYRQQPGRGMWLVARTRVPPDNLAPAIQREVQALDQELPVSPAPVARQFGPNYQYQYRGLTAALFLTFAAMALLLASVGLYAVIGHSVSARTQEIGIRTAMGATARDILTLVFRQGMLPVAIGLTIGLAATFAVMPILKPQLVQVSPTDPATLAVTTATLLAAATLGCLIPALRAMRVDPLVALRNE